MRPKSILALAGSGGDELEVFRLACAKFFAQPVVIAEAPEPFTNQGTGHIIRSYRCFIRDPDGNEAEVVYHIGTKGDNLYSGYDEYPDEFRVTIDGREYYSQISRPDYGEKSSPRAIARWVVSALHMTVHDAIFARLLDGRPVVDA